MSLEAAVRSIRDSGVPAVAVVSREGTVLAADMPPGVSRETFSIMCATIHGAGMTVSSEIRRSMPRRVIIDSQEGRIVISEAGRRALVVLVLSGDADVDAVAAKVEPFLAQIAREAR